MSRLKIGVIGAGYFGKLHVKTIYEMSSVTLAAVVDIDEERARTIANTYGVAYYTCYKEVLNKVDAVSIATPTSTHFEIASFFLKNKVPCLLEKPMTKTIDEAEEIVNIVNSTGTYLQVGYVERFNPAFLEAQRYIKTPRFIECHRLAPFKFRSMDIDVTSDLMSHDLDIILSIQRSHPKQINAVGASLLFGTPDIVNTRLEFEDGCVANITSSRISDKSMRKMRIFCDNCYISIDFSTKSSKVYTKTPALEQVISKIKEESLSPDEIAVIMPKFYSVIELKNDTDPLRNEFEAFVDAIANKRPSSVPASHGLAVLKLLSLINQEISSHRWEGIK